MWPAGYFEPWVSTPRHSKPCPPTTPCAETTSSPHETVRTIVIGSLCQLGYQGIDTPPIGNMPGVDGEGFEPPGPSRAAGLQPATLPITLYPSISSTRVASTLVTDPGSLLARRLLRSMERTSIKRIEPPSGSCPEEAHSLPTKWMMRSTWSPTGVPTLQTQGRLDRTQDKESSGAQSLARI